MPTKVPRNVTTEFDSVSAKNHIFLNEARWTRLENKTLREIMNMDRNTELKRLL